MPVVEAVVAGDEPGDQEVTVRQCGNPLGDRLGGRVVVVGVTRPFVSG